MAPNSISAVTPFQTPLRELTALSQTAKLDLRGPTSEGKGEGEMGR